MKLIGIFWKPYILRVQTDYFLVLSLPIVFLNLNRADAAIEIYKDMNPMVKIEAKPSLYLNDNDSKFENFDSFLKKAETVTNKIQPVLSKYDIIIVSCDSLLQIVS